MDDTKPKSVPKSVSEHPISEAEAKKYAGAGDFSLPTQASPLDNLIGTQVKTAPPAAAPTAKPETPAAAPMPVPSSASTKDLEKKAKELLKGTDTKPIKKKRSRTATTMALAAVLMVMMGAGGIAGMNLLKMQQVAENRSQAAVDDCTDGTHPYKVNSTGCIDYAKYATCVAGRWVGSNNCGAGERCVTSVENDGYASGTCQMVENQTTTCNSPYSCVDNGMVCVSTIENTDCGDNKKCGSSCTSSGGGGTGSYCTANSCDAGNDYPAKCGVFHYFSPKHDTQSVVVSNCRVQMDEGDVVTEACWAQSASFKYDCGVEQIDVMCNGSTVDHISVRRDIDCNTQSPPPTEPPPTAPPPTEPPPTEPPPTEPPPTAEPMSCIGIDPRSPTGLTVGSVAEFTCAGTGTGLTYNFRVRVNGGTWTEYINDDGLDSAGGQLIFAKQGNNLKFRINQAGAYDVECRACTGRAGAGCTTWGLAQ